MPKTHLELVEEADNGYLDALRNDNTTEINRYIHRDIVLANNRGEIYKGSENHPMLSGHQLVFDQIDLLERSVSIFTSVAFINSFEQRKGTYRDSSFDDRYGLTRVWKFEEFRWQLIGTVAIKLSEAVM